MNRRAFLATAAAATMIGRSTRGDDVPRTSMGIVEHCYGQRTAVERKTHEKALVDDPVEFLKFCRQRGASGAQMNLGAGQGESAERVVDVLSEEVMFLEGSISVPVNVTQVERARQMINGCFQSSAFVIRTVLLPGRRYEHFRSARAFRTAADEAHKSIAFIKPLINVYGGMVSLAIENHKDWRTNELVALLERLDSPNIGVCLDTGNSIALLEDPMETIEQLAPWAFTTHLKDMAVEEYEDGFLLAEVPLGKGFLDLPRIVSTLRKARPNIKFNLEMITRDPLKIPCLTPGYWPTFDGPMGWPLARTLKMVRAHASKTPLPRVSQLTDEARVKLEDDNVRESLKYAREQLGLKA